MRDDNVCKGILVPGLPHPLLCPEKNEGWQTGTTGPETERKEVLLFKDDLVWKSIYKADDLDKFRVNSIESTMPGIFRDTVIDGITLYEDVFMGMPELDHIEKV